VELYFRSPNTPSWCGAQLKEKYRYIFTFTDMYLHLVVLNEAIDFLQNMYCFYNVLNFTKFTNSNLFPVIN